MDENKIAQDDPQYELHCLRHSAAHLMAHAVQTFFPDAKFAIGPVIKKEPPFAVNILLRSSGIPVVPSAR